MLLATLAQPFPPAFFCVSSLAMPDLSAQFVKAGEAHLKNLRVSVCQSPDEHSAFNLAISGTPHTPEPEAVLRFLAEARNQARGHPGDMAIEEHLLTFLIGFTEEDLIALRP